MNHLKRILLTLSAGFAAGSAIAAIAAMVLWFAESELRTTDPEWYLRGWLHVSKHILVVCTAIGTVTSLVYAIRKGKVRLFRIIVYVVGFALLAAFVSVFFQPLKGPGLNHWIAATGAVCGGFCAYWFCLPSEKLLYKTDEEVAAPVSSREFDGT